MTESIAETQYFPKSSMESLGRVSVFTIHSTTIQFSNQKSWADHNYSFAFLSMDCDLGEVILIGLYLTYLWSIQTNTSNHA